MVSGVHLLSLGDGALPRGVRWVGLERSVDDIGEAPFEDSDGLELGVADSSTASEERDGLRVVVGLGDGDAVDCGVELAVADAAQPR